MSTDTAASYHASAISLAVGGDLEAALPLFEGAVRLEPSNVGYLNDLAVTFMNSGELDVALVWFKKALELNPEHPDVNKNMDFLQAHLDHRQKLLESKELEEARAMAEGAKEQDDEPYSPGSYKNPNAPRKPRPKTAPAAEEGERRGLPTRPKGSPKPDKSDKKKKDRPKVTNMPAAAADVYASGESRNVDGRDADGKTADDYRQAAYALGNAGEYEEALPLFEKASALAPTNVAMMNDLGVTYLRLNMIDDTKRVFDKALEIQPDYGPILDNYVALQQHLDYRQEQLKKIEEEEREGDFMAGMESARNDDQPENRRGLPTRPKGAAKVVHVDPNYMKAGVYDDEDEEIEAKKPSMPAAEGAWFGSWYTNEALRESIRAKLSSGKPVVIKNVFREDFAEKLHEEIYNSGSFKPYEGYYEYYQFALHAIYHGTPEWNAATNPVLDDVYAFLDSSETKEWASYVTGTSVTGSTQAGAAWYKANDYTMPHTDFSYSSDAREAKRRLAFVIHMTKDWDVTLGGDLVFMDPTYHITPEFNTMTMFPVTQDTWHFVSPVAKHCPEDKKRLALSGWWMSENVDEVDELFGQDENEKKQRTFLLSVEGKTGEVLPYKRIG